YAVGECVEHRGRVYGLVVPLFEQARVLADHITGTELASSYHGSKLSTRLKVMGVDLVSAGDARPLEARDVSASRYAEPERGVYKKLVVRQGKISGAILLGDIDCAGAVLSAFETETEIGERHADLLFGSTPVGQGIEALPSEALICSCHQVSKSR